MPPTLEPHDRPLGTRPELHRRHLLLAGVGAPLLGVLPAEAGHTAAPRGRSGRRRSRRDIGPTLPVLTATGLYAWPYDYLTNRAQMRSLGSTTLRLGMTGMNDATWAAVVEDGYDAHITVSGGDRAQFGDETMWIADYLRRLDSILGRWPFRWVEIWNEPNFGMWTGATAAQKQVAYGSLLVAAYGHVKAHYPGTAVVGFGAGGSSAAAPGFIRGVLAAVPAATASFDVLSMHPYIAPTAPELVRSEPWGSWSIEGQVQAIRKAGVTAPIWFTEVGWEISHTEGGRYAKAPTRVVSAQLQAAYTVRTAVLAMRLGVERVHHMYVIDTDHYNGGFFTAAGPRSQARAMAFQHEALEGPSAIQTLTSSASGISAYRVQTVRGPVIVAWSDGGGRLEVSRRAEVRNLYGDRVRRRRSSVALGPSPVYVVEAALSRPRTSRANRRS